MLIHMTKRPKGLVIPLGRSVEEHLLHYLFEKVHPNTKPFSWQLAGRGPSFSIH